MTLRQIINLITFTLTLFLLVPTALILASWNSLPGESLYPTKRNLETIALTFLSPSYQAQTSLQTKLISRRLEEATTTIDKKSSSAGLDELKTQVQTAQTQVQKAPTPEAKQQVSQKLVKTLFQTQQQLETKKQVITQTIVRNAAPTVSVTPAPLPEADQPRAETPTPTPTDVPEEIIDNIEEVQEEIENIITELKQPENQPPGMMMDQDNRGRSEDQRQDENRGNSEEHRQENRGRSED